MGGAREVVIFIQWFVPWFHPLAACFLTAYIPVMCTTPYFGQTHPEYKLHCGFTCLHFSFQCNLCIKNCVHCVANIVNHHPSPDSTVNYFIVGEKIEILQKMCKCGTWIDLMVGSAANVDVDFHLLLLAGGQTLV